MFRSGLLLIYFVRIGYILIKILTSNDEADVQNTSEMNEQGNIIYEYVVTILLYGYQSLLYQLIFVCLMLLANQKKKKVLLQFCFSPSRSRMATTWNIISYLSLLLMLSFNMFVFIGLSYYTVLIKSQKSNYYNNITKVQKN